MTPLTDEADKIAEDVLRDYRISKTDLIQRLLFFLEAAPGSVRQTMIGMIPPDMKAPFLEASAKFFTAVIEGEIQVRKPMPKGRPGRKSSEPDHPLRVKREK
ncbi:MAG TPA: hypothetical protein VK797_23455 [Tepidisphaeraceae bacterium]|nr:hypothetical protein [Tepidisphaeraceae bacterium]